MEGAERRDWKARGSPTSPYFRELPCVPQLGPGSHQRFSNDLSFKNPEGFPCQKPFDAWTALLLWLSSTGGSELRSRVPPRLKTG